MKKSHLQKCKNSCFSPRRYKLISLVNWFYEIASRGQPDYYTIIDMKYNPLFRFKIELNEFIQRFYRTQPMNWETLEIVSLSL